MRWTAEHWYLGPYLRLAEKMLAEAARELQLGKECEAERRKRGGSRRGMYGEELYESRAREILDALSAALKGE